MQTRERETRRRNWRMRRGALFISCAIFVLATASIALASDARLDENEEVQWVMGDLSALRTAAQTYYTDNGNQRVPPLSAILEYFEPGSLPSNAATLYALRGDGRGWYVGYETAGLKSETYALLQGDAQALELLGDDLRTPWRRGSRYFWTRALSLATENTAGTTTIIKTGSDNSAAALVFATLVGIVIDSRRERYCYYVPGHSGYWYSALLYRPVCRSRFFDRYYRPRPGPPPRFAAPRHRYGTPRVALTGAPSRLPPPRGERDRRVRRVRPETPSRNGAPRPATGERRPPSVQRPPQSPRPSRPSSGNEEQRPPSVRRPSRPERSPGAGSGGRSPNRSPSNRRPSSGGRPSQPPRSKDRPPRIEEERRPPNDQRPSRPPPRR
jgi:hypothetical protein